MKREKVMFALDIRDGWPPVSSEGVWCERVESYFKLANSPFFISGIAYGDIFEATPDEVNHHVFDFKIIEESGHSVVWVLNNSGADTSEFAKEIESLGCRVEGFPKFSLYSVDVPPTIDVATLDAVIGKYESKGLNFAYPAWRHKSV